MRRQDILLRLQFSGWIGLCLMPALALAAGLPQVPAPREPVTNIFHGIAVVDEYQWLEDAAAPAAREWTRVENERTRARLDKLPYREGLAEELTQLRGEESARTMDLRRAGGRHFAMRFKPPDPSHRPGDVASGV